MIYIASPYTHEVELIRVKRYEMAKAFAAELMREGLPVYSPIVHGHDIAMSHDLPTDWAFWKNHCLAMLRKADYMIVLTIPGWEDSTGLQAEIEFCQACGITVEYRYQWGHLV